MTFDDAFERLIGHEGGYSNHPADPGKETMWGVTIAVARAHGYDGPMRDLPLCIAKDIYARKYWLPAGCELVPAAIRFDLFDMAVNSGPVQSIKTLQRAVGEAPDGVIGRLTLLALSSIPPSRLVARFNAQRMVFITALPDKWWDSFGRGVMNRIAANLMSA